MSINIIDNYGLSIKNLFTSSDLNIVFDGYDQKKLEILMSKHSFWEGYKESIFESFVKTRSINKIADFLFKKIFDILLIENSRFEENWNFTDIDNRFYIQAPQIFMQNDEKGLRAFAKERDSYCPDDMTTFLFKADMTVLKLSKDNRDKLLKVFYIYPLAFYHVEFLLRFMMSYFIHNSCCSFGFYKQKFFRIEADIDRFNKKISNVRLQECQ